MREMNTEMELNMDELEQVNGGNMLCAFWGYGVDGREATACCFKGASTEDGEHGGFGAAACIFSVLGVGFALTGD